MNARYFLLLFFSLNVELALAFINAHEYYLHLAISFFQMFQCAK